MTGLTKNCPTCNSIMSYSRKDSLKESIDKNRQCKKCAKKDTIPSFIEDGTISKEVLKLISKTWFKNGDRPVNADAKKGLTYEDIYGIKKAKDIKDKLSSYIRTTEANEKRRAASRLIMIERLRKINKSFHPPYNPKACQYFNQLMKESNTYIQHAENGGEFLIRELGYWVDGYDQINNIVYEYDEKHHFVNEQLLNKDVRRQQEITNFLKCKFIRIKESI